MKVLMRSVTIGELAKAIDFDNYFQGFRDTIEKERENLLMLVAFEEEIIFSAALVPLIPVKGSTAPVPAKGSPIIAACALGIAALNLGVTPYAITKAFKKANLGAVTVLVIEANDARKTPKQIARMVRRELKGRLQETVQIKEFDYHELFSNYKGRKL